MISNHAKYSNRVNERFKVQSHFAITSEKSEKKKKKKEQSALCSFLPVARPNATTTTVLTKMTVITTTTMTTTITHDTFHPVECNARQNEKQSTTWAFSFDRAATNEPVASHKHRAYMLNQT